MVEEFSDARGSVGRCGDGNNLRLDSSVVRIMGSYDNSSLKINK